MENTEQKKSGEEVLAEIYRNAQLALQSISDILPQTDDGGVKCEIMREHEEYERICGKAAELAKRLNVEVKEPNPVKKAMMWSAIKMNSAADNSDAHIAEMMIKGTVTGITALKTTQSDSHPIASDEVKELLEELISLEEGFEENLKKYL